MVFRCTTQDERTRGGRRERLNGGGRRRRGRRRRRRRKRRARASGSRRKRMAYPTYSVSAWVLHPSDEEGNIREVNISQSFINFTVVAH